MRASRWSGRPCFSPPVHNLHCRRPEQQEPQNGTFGCLIVRVAPSGNSSRIEGLIKPKAPEK